MVRASALTMTSANTGLASSSALARARSVPGSSRVRMLSATAASETPSTLSSRGTSRMLVTDSTPGAPRRRSRSVRNRVRDASSNTSPPGAKVTMSRSFDA